MVWCAMCLQEEEEEQLDEEDPVKEETAEQEIPNWAWARGHKHTSSDYSTRNFLLASQSF